MRDLTNQRFAKLFVTERAGTEKYGQILWQCQCDCGNYCLVRGADLRSGNTKSCGRCPINTYDLSGEYGVGYTSKNDIFYFDLADYDSIKDYHWYKSVQGYICARSNRNIGSSVIRLHRLIMHCEDNNLIVDHINHNKSDNRKTNLRICTQKENTRNSVLNKNSVSGIIGVTYRKDSNKWRSRLRVDGKLLSLGVFVNKNDAIIARLKAEKKYFGEFAPQKDLFDKYNI